MSINDEYWKLITERDAAWEEYCQFPSDDLWAAFIEAEQAEKQMAKKIAEQCRASLSEAMAKVQLKFDKGV